MVISVRRANIEDLDYIRDFCRGLFEYDAQFDDTLDIEWPYTEDGKDELADRLIDEDDSCVFLASDGDNVVGYLVGLIEDAGSHRTVGKMGELEHMYIKEDYRRKGVGSKLCESFFDWCKSKDVNRATVISSSENFRALAFYRKQGFFDFDICLEMDL